MKIGVLVPAAGKQEKMARGAGRLAGQFGGLEVECQFVAGSDQGELVILPSDEFTDIAVTSDPAGGGDAPVRRVAGLIVNWGQRQVAWQILSRAVAVPVQIGRR